mmetsp:Transcript_10977/g.23936  ORF Transcript_10977/g.23936 Transcript_10977/m.23936 type:complete len:254 (+) Transcript_10977:104-865(+)
MDICAGHGEKPRTRAVFFVARSGFTYHSFTSEPERPSCCCALRLRHAKSHFLLGAGQCCEVGANGVRLRAAHMHDLRDCRGARLKAARVRRAYYSTQRPASPRNTCPTRGSDCFEAATSRNTPPFQPSPAHHAHFAPPRPHLLGSTSHGRSPRTRSVRPDVVRSPLASPPRRARPSPPCRWPRGTHAAAAPPQKSRQATTLAPSQGFVHETLREVHLDDHRHGLWRRRARLRQRGPAGRRAGRSHSTRRARAR